MLKSIRAKMAIQKELKSLQKQEEKMQKTAMKQPVAASWKTELEKKVPEKVYSNLKLAFGKAFSIIFEKGTGIIEKSYNKDAIHKEQKIRDYAVQVKGNRRELRKVKKSAEVSGLGNMALTTVEGIGLGALGVGLPDIVMFVGVLLKGIYETALHYGIDYTHVGERYLILKMMEASLAKGEHWVECNAEVDRLIYQGRQEIPDLEDMEEQRKRTADAFAIDMILLKFIQGLPIVGILGGAGNPVYYNKVMHYVRIKYQKRYLLQLERKQK
ncbi:MAG: EcsC family protein [Lachnospiraceae bacterium]|nr:EcsC family protein [Lachnospiraceae bacterium]